MAQNISNDANFGLPRHLDDNLVLRWATEDDTDALAELNAYVFSESDSPDEAIEVWTRELMRGDHPAVKPNDFTVVVDESNDGKIVSTLNLISQTWTYDGIPFGVGRVELVATHPEYRRKGLVRQQMEAIHAKSAARGELMQAITGIPWYYRQFGYEMALDLQGGRRLYSINISRLGKDESEIYRLRPATVEDIPALSQLYNVYCSYNLVSRVRNETEWKYELTAVSEKSLTYRRFHVIERIADNEPIGYLEIFFWPNITAVRELAILPGYSWRGIGEFLTRANKTLADEQSQKEKRETPREDITFSLGLHHPIYEALGNQLEKQSQPYAWYIRIPDLPAFIQKIAPVLELRLQNSVVEGFSGDLRLNFYRSHIKLVFEQGKLKEIGTYEKAKVQDGDANFPDLTFYQLLLGYRSLEELRYAFPDCFVRNERAVVLLNALFPKKTSNVIPLE